MFEGSRIHPRAGDPRLISNFLCNCSLQVEVVNRTVELETRLMANPASAQRIDQCVVHEAFLFFKDLFTLLARARTAETLCQFVLDQRLSLDLPTGVGLNPFERATRTT